jgi:F0F1-type ATP synthase membrane subunit c/vacuolar-type H+-ATPase subunit K
MPTGFGWFWAALIVGGAYLIGGIIVGWFGYSETRAAGGVAPTRTLNVLKQDQVWIQNEARTA